MLPDVTREIDPPPPLQLVRPLSSVLSSLNITPISEEALERHKRTEAARHPSSRLWRYRRAFKMVGDWSPIAAAAAMAQVVLTTIRWSGGAATGAELALSGVVMGVTCAVMIKTNFSILHSPAVWKEERPANLWAVPAPIRLRAMQVDRSATVSFIIGTLYQEQTVLDPYLLVEKRNPLTGEVERACLGIWDGQTVIKCA